MHGLLILNWSRTPEPMQIHQVDLRSRQDLLPAFMKETGLFFYPPGNVGHQTSAQEYLELLSRCVIMETVGGIDFEAASRSCLRFLQNGSI